MTEKEKMLRGLSYNTLDPALIAQYQKARKLLKTFNALDADKMAERAELLSKLLGKKGDRKSVV